MIRRLRRSAATLPVIIVALGKHGDKTTSEDVVTTSLEATIESLRALKTDGAKPQARPE
jgi:hypothetical protein